MISNKRDQHNSLSNWWCLLLYTRCYTT